MDQPQYLQIGDEITLFGTDEGKSLLSCPESVDGGVLLIEPSHLDLQGHDPEHLKVTNTGINDVTNSTFQLLAAEKYQQIQNLEQHVCTKRSKVRSEARAGALPTRSHNALSFVQNAHAHAMPMHMRSTHVRIHAQFVCTMAKKKEYWC